MALDPCSPSQTSRCRLVVAALAAALSFSVPLFAQEPPPAEAPGESTDGAAEPVLGWQPGPITAALGSLAQVDLPEGYAFLDADDTRTILQSMGNLVGESEQGSVFPTTEDQDWFLVFEFDEVGYVKDDDKDELDAEELLASMRESNQRANEVKRERGLPEMTLIGWETPPHYDSSTQNLEWCLRYEAEGAPVLNCNTRLLGRRGVMSVTLVADPEDLAAATPQSQTLLASYAFTSGERYAEFKKGDKIAEYGLAGLVLGGAAAAALKTGLLQKFWKLIVVGVIALGSAVKKLFGGRGRGTDPALPPPPTAAT